MSFHLGSIGVAKVKLIAYKSTDVDASSLSIISWNIEGLSKNYLTLYNFVKQFAAKLIFLSEPQSYRCDLAPLLTPFIGSYEAHLNSEDAHDMDLPLTHPKAKGGTMILWHSSLSPESAPNNLSMLCFCPTYSAWPAPLSPHSCIPPHGWQRWGLARLSS